MNPFLFNVVKLKQENRYKMDNWISTKYNFPQQICQKSEHLQNCNQTLYNNICNGSESRQKEQNKK